MHALALRAQLVHRHAVLAGQVVQAAETALVLFELLRVGIEVIVHPVQQRQGFVQLDRGVLDQTVHLAQARVVLDQARQLVAHLLQQVQRRAAVVAVELVAGGLAGAQQGAGVGLAAMAGTERHDRLRLQVFAVQLAQLVFQEADPVTHVALLRQRQRFIDQCLPCGRGAAHLAALVLVAGIGIQQGQLRRARQQGLLFVLAVDLHQQRGQVAQLGQGHRAAIDPRPRTAVCTDHAAQLALFFVVQLVVGQPLARGLQLVQRELGRKLGARGAVADHAAVGAQAGQEAQRVDHQRLAGAGLA